MVEKNEEKQRASGDSEVAHSATSKGTPAPQAQSKKPFAIVEESEANVQPEQSESKCFRTKVDIHSERISYAKQTQNTNKVGAKKNKEVSETRGGHEQKQSLETKEASETGGVRSKAHSESEKHLKTAIRSKTSDGHLEEISEVESKNLSRVFHLENRDIFETGGSPVENRFAGPHKGGETSEADNNPEAISSSTTDLEIDNEEASVAFLIGRCWRSPRDLCLKGYGNCSKRIVNWWRHSRCRNQLTTAPVYYAIAFIMCLLCLVVAVRISADQRDIPICIRLLILFCSTNSLIIPRGWLRDSTDIGKEQLFTNTRRRRDIHGRALVPKRPWRACLSCCCNEVDASLPRVLEGMNWRENSNLNTAFEHEVVDVSKLAPGECPRITSVESKDFLSSSSPEGETFETAAAVVHPSEADLEPKEGVQSYENCCEAEPRGSGTQGPREEENFEVTGNFENHGFSYEQHSGQDIECPQLVVQRKSKVSKCASPKRSEEDVFICEHYGQAVACACAELARKK